MCTDVRGEFVDWASVRDHLDEACAFDRPEQRRAITRRCLFEVRDAVVEKARRPPKDHRRLDRSLRPPFENAVARRGSADTDDDPALDGVPGVLEPQCGDFYVKRDIALARGRVLDQNGAREDRIVNGLRTQR